MIEFKQYICSDSCIECKGCCVFSCRDWLPQLFSKEKEILGKSTVMLQEKAGICFCEYLQPGSHRCKIYVNRPFECRLYPFLINKKDAKLELAAHLACPYVINRIKEKQFQDYCSYINNVIRIPENIEILKRHFSIFKSYPDIELYVIDADLLKKVQS